MLSSDFVTEVNRRSVASFTPAAQHPLLYISITKRSIRFMWLDSIPNRRSVASFTPAAQHPLLYISTTKRSIHCMWIDSIPNRRSVASFTPAAQHPLLYISTTKRSIHCTWIDSIPNMLGFNISATNVSIRSGKLFQTAQTVFLPHPRN